MQFIRRIKLLELVVAMVVALLATACSGQGSSDLSSAGDSVTRIEDENGSAPEPVTIRLVTNIGPPPFNISVGMERFAEAVQERIDGSQVWTYYSGALYPGISEALDAMVTGNLEMVVGQTSFAAGFEPMMNIATQPMAYTTVGAVREFPNTETAKALEKQMLDKGIRILGWPNVSFILGFTSPERIASLEDFRGKKLRVIAPLTQTPLLQAWRASPITMPFQEAVVGMETGAVDGVLTSISGYETAFMDLAPYYTVPGMGGSVVAEWYFIGVSEKWWNTLNEATRAVIVEEAERWIGKFGSELTYCDDLRALEVYGVQDPSQPGVYIMPEAEQQKLMAATGDVVKEALVQALPEAAQWVEAFINEGRALSDQYPPGSHPFEQIDCSPYWELREQEG